MIPFNIPDIVRLHQIPSSPSTVCIKAYAIGILAKVRAPLDTDGGAVFPRPANTPAKVSSTHINT